MFCLKLSGTAIIAVKNFDFSCIFYEASKSDTFQSLENSVLDDRVFI